MRALVYTGPETLALQDLAEPEPKAGEALVRVDSAGICGSDMHAYLGHDDRRPAPLILGHEVAGIVAGGRLDGRRVTINPLVTCGTCAACVAGRENLCAARQIISMPPRPGAFAQYVTVPETNLVEVPDPVSLETAALVEPLAVSWHAARLGLAALGPGISRNALVIGGGAIGLAGALALKAMSVGNVVITELDPARRDFLTTRCGVMALERAEGSFGLILDAVGLAATRAVASTLAEPGGVIVHIGLGHGQDGLDIRRMTLQEITLIGSYTYSRRDFRDTAQAMFDGRLGALDWTESRPLDDGIAAFRELREGRVAAPKIILKPELA